MQLKFILRREGGTAAHVAVTADATASVGDLAMALTIGDPERRPTKLPTNPTKSSTARSTTERRGASSNLAQPHRPRMRSGSTVSLAPATRPVLAPSRRGRSVAVLRGFERPWMPAANSRFLQVIPSSEPASPATWC